MLGHVASGGATVAEAGESAGEVVADVDGGGEEVTLAANGTVEGGGFAGWAIEVPVHGDWGLAIQWLLGWEVGENGSELSSRFSICIPSVGCQAAYLLDEALAIRASSSKQLRHSPCP